MKKPTYEEVVAALKSAVEHLDWIGWGDSWEQECIRDSGDQKRIYDTLAAAQTLEIPE